MDCMKKCWVPDGDFDIHYDSDSSVGLAGDDDNKNNDNNKLGEISNVKENVFICNECAIYQKAIIELRSMLMEQRRDDFKTTKQLKTKYNKLLQKYREKKDSVKQLAISHLNDNEKIENIINEIERLSNNNYEILKEKHEIERQKEELKNKNINLENEININHQTIHKLKLQNNRMQSEMQLASENHSKYSAKLLKELNDTKQENMAFSYKMSAKSMANIHENNNNVWVNFEHAIPPNTPNTVAAASASTSVSNTPMTRSRSRSAPADQSDNESISDSAADHIAAHHVHNTELMSAQSMSMSITNAANELPSIDEQNEQSEKNKKQANNPSFIRNRSISSDGTYDYEEELSNGEINGPHIIQRSPSQQSLSNLWQQKSYESYKYNYYNGSFNNNKRLSFRRNSGLDTPISPLTVTGNYSLFDADINNNNIQNNNKLPKIASGAIMYVDNDGIDMTDDTAEYEESKERQDDEFELENELQNEENVNQKLQVVSLENNSLKLKNDKLRKEIQELTKQLQFTAK